MKAIKLTELQEMWRAQQRARRRGDLHRYLIDHDEPSSVAFVIVSRRLYAEGRIDNLGLAIGWVESATEEERATLFSQIATDLLKV